MDKTPKARKQSLNRRRQKKTGFLGQSAVGLTGFRICQIDELKSQVYFSYDRKALRTVFSC